MEYAFYLEGVKPISVNHSHYGTFKKNIKTRAWEHRLKQLFLPHMNCVKKIRESFDPKNHVFVRQYIYLMNHKIFYTKSGEISKRKNDVSNVAKIPEDEIFNRIIGIDDKYIQRGVVELIPWERDYALLCLVKIESFDDIESRSKLWKQYVTRMECHSL